MHIERKKCPYCEEDIALSAKKCRFCGEWLPEEEEMQMSEHDYQDSPVEPQNIIPPVQSSAPASQLEMAIPEDTYSFSPTLLNFICVLGIGGAVVMLISLLLSNFGDLSGLLSFSGCIMDASFIAVYFMLAYKLKSDNVITRAQGMFGMTGIMAVSFLVNLFSDDEMEFAEVLTIISFLAEIVIAIVLITKNDTRKIGIWSLVSTAGFLIFAYWILPEIFSGYRGSGNGRFITLLVIFPVVKFFESSKKYLCNQQSEEGVSIEDV